MTMPNNSRGMSNNRHDGYEESNLGSPNIMSMVMMLMITMLMMTMINYRHEDALLLVTLSDD